eukprot:GEMP01054966.1.p1 GENE.GEMP01054966.1~~GEMP01054966.1.p1  ORF type:complete len:401 (+),score=92.02 GEMP01054966.1:165-1367(+)
MASQLPEHSDRVELGNFGPVIPLKEILERTRAGLDAVSKQGKIYIPEAEQASLGPNVFEKKSEVLALVLRKDQETLLFNTVPSGADVYHAGFINYLNYCWSSHNGVVLTPDILWFTILTEIALSVNAAPEAFRAIYTDAPEGAEKKEVLIGNFPSDPQFLHEFCAKLKELVPVNVDLFLPKFSTTGPEAEMAICSAFLQAAAEFYFIRGGCGIPRVAVRGTSADYAKMVDNLDAMKAFWPVKDGTMRSRYGICAVTGKQYLEKAIDICSQIAKQVKRREESRKLNKKYIPTAAEVTFWKKMYYRNELCASATPVAADAVPCGWILDLVVSRRNNTANAATLPVHATEVPFQLQGEEREYCWRSGVFSATYNAERDLLEPAFSHFITMKTPVDNEKINAKK